MVSFKNPDVWRRITSSTTFIQVGEIKEKDQPFCFFLSCWISKHTPGEGGMMEFKLNHFSSPDQLIQFSIDQQLLRPQKNRQPDTACSSWKNPAPPTRTPYREIKSK